LTLDAQQSESERRPGETLRASSISRSYDGVKALRGVTLELRRGEVVGLIGPNGAGKSTLVNVLSGFDRPDEGTVVLGDHDVTRWSPHRRGRHGLARTFQHSHSFGSLSVRENVEVAALGVCAGPRRAAQRADSLLAALGLNIALAIQGRFFALLAAQLAFYVAALIGGAAEALGRRVPIASSAFSFAVANAGFLVGIVNSLRRVRITFYEPHHHAKQTATDTDD